MKIKGHCPTTMLKENKRYCSRSQKGTIQARMLIASFLLLVLYGYNSTQFHMHFFDAKPTTASACKVLQWQAQSERCWEDGHLGSLLYNTCGGFRARDVRTVLFIDSKEHYQLWQQVPDFMVCLLRHWLPPAPAGIAICFTCQVFPLPSQRAQPLLSFIKVPG